MDISYNEVTVSKAVNAATRVADLIGGYYNNGDEPIASVADQVDEGVIKDLLVEILKAEYARMEDFGDAIGAMQVASAIAVLSL